MLSADISPTQIEKMLQGGARDYLTKPFEIKRLLCLVDEALAVVLHRPRLTNFGSGVRCRPDSGHDSPSEFSGKSYRAVYFDHGETSARAISSVVERLLHTQEVAGSNPASRKLPQVPATAHRQRLFEAPAKVRSRTTPATLRVAMRVGVRTLHRANLPFADS